MAHAIMICHAAWWAGGLHAASATRAPHPPAPPAAAAGGGGAARAQQQAGAISQVCRFDYGLSFGSDKKFPFYGGSLLERNSSSPAPRSSRRERSAAKRALAKHMWPERLAKSRGRSSRRFFVLRGQTLVPCSIPVLAQLHWPSRKHACDASRKPSAERRRLQRFHAYKKGDLSMKNPEEPGVANPIVSMLSAGTPMSSHNVFPSRDLTLTHPEIPEGCSKRTRVCSTDLPFFLPTWMMLNSCQRHSRTTVQLFVETPAGGQRGRCIGGSCDLSGSETHLD